MAQPTWSRDAWAVSITAMHVSRARFSTIAQTFVEEDAISLLREVPIVAAADDDVDLWPDAGGDLLEDAFAFFAGGSRALSMSTAHAFSWGTKICRWQEQRIVCPSSEHSRTGHQG